jgi:hypothetical protein
MRRPSLARDFPRSSLGSQHATALRTCADVQPLEPFHRRLRELTRFTGA